MGRVVPLSLLLAIGLCGPSLAQERRGPVFLGAGGGPALTTAWYDEYVEVPGFEPAERVRSTEYGAVGSLLVGLAVGREISVGGRVGLVFEAAALYWAGSDEQMVALSLAIGIVPVGARRRE